MAKPMKKLRTKMYEQDVLGADIGKLIGRCTGYVSERLCAKASFTTNDAHKICKVLGIPLSEMADYFPEV